MIPYVRLYRTVQLHECVNIHSTYILSLHSLSCTRGAWYMRNTGLDLEGVSQILVCTITIRGVHYHTIIAFTVRYTVRYHQNQNLFQIKLPGHEMISLKHETEILYSASALIRHCATLLTHVLGAKCCTVAWNQPHAGLKI